jgi:transcriptional regulator with XRE-family HTH domain
MEETIRLIDPEKLKRARGDRDLGDVAEFVGCSTMFLRYVEQGKRGISDEKLAKLCQLYGVKPHNLIAENFLSTASTNTANR